MKLKLLGAPLLILLLAAIAGGWLGGNAYTKNRICGDLYFYFKQDNPDKKENLVAIRSCEGK